MAKKKKTDQEYKVSVTKKARARVLGIPGRGVYHFEDEPVKITLNPAQVREVEALGYKVEPVKAEPEPEKAAKTGDGPATDKEK